MSSTEDRLRAAFRAQAEQLTEPKLDALAARHDAGIERDDLVELQRGEHTVVLEPMDFEQHRSRRTRRYVAPLLAAAAVAAVAAGVAVLTGTSQHGGGPVINQPGASTSGATTIPSPSQTSGPSPSSSKSAPNRPGYLPAGQTGARSDIPWSAVGLGWRLVQPSDPTNSLGHSVYLYDPAGGRYLISDQIAAGNSLAGWSADAGRAALQHYDGAGVSLLDLHSGAITRLSQQGSFATFTRPKGQAVVVYESATLVRLGLDGSEQQRYSNDMNGIGQLGGSPIYRPDGSAFAITAFPHTALIGNDGKPLAVFPLPAGYVSCETVRLWDDHTLLERCQTSQPGYSLFLQDLEPNATPTTLLARAGQNFISAWPLSNSDVVVQTTVTCTNNAYQILHPDGSLSPLRLPPGVEIPSTIATLTGDHAVFVTHLPGCSGTVGDSTLVSYDMVTGATSTLLDSAGIVVDLPAF